MLVRSLKLFLAVGLVVVVWGLTASREAGTRSWIQTSGISPGPVRILQFYANVGSVKAGEKAMLCYGVENAKSVRIAPPVAGAFPASKRCLEIVPQHTTHYTILAEGFDGRVAVRSLTLAVRRPPAAPPQPLLLGFEDYRSSTSSIHSRAN
jgi:hypothetical protein